MSSDLEKTNLKQNDQSKSEYHSGNEQAGLMKELNLDVPSNKSNEGSLSITQPLKDSQRQESTPNLKTEAEKDLSKPSEGQPEVNQEKEVKGGIFSKMGHAISSVFEKTKEIIFPNLGGGEEEEPKKEKENEKDKILQKQDDNPKEEKFLEPELANLEEKPYEMPTQKNLQTDKLQGAGQKFDKNRHPAYIVGEGEKKIVYYYPLEQNLGEKSNLLKTMPEPQLGEVVQPLLSGQEKEIPCQDKESREQPKEEVSTPIKEEDKHKPELDTEKVRGKLENLNLNKDEPQISAPEKEELKHNQNFFQDISKTLQFGEKPHQEQAKAGKDESSAQQKIQ